tara:strand:+ start:441 stop:749 length:309 start_codon:yes stop_codon:yes gene_type:complete
VDKKTIRITGAQCSFSVGAIQENKETILNCFEEAESVESDIVIFPELAITGYPPEDLLLRESFIGKNFAVLEEIAAFSLTQVELLVLLIERTIPIIKTIING